MDKLMAKSGKMLSFHPGFNSSMVILIVYAPFRKLDQVLAIYFSNIVKTKHLFPLLMEIGIF